MNFADLRFWGYLLFGLLIVLSLRGLIMRIGVRAASYDRVSLAALGIFLLGCVGGETLGFFLVIWAITYFGLSWIIARYPTREQRLRWLWALIPLQLLPLAYVKYADFALNRVLGMEFGAVYGLMIPVGISFYTFQLVGYSIDTIVHRQKQPKLLNSLNFAGFFPQIVAGPIERRSNLLSQIEEFRFRFKWNDIEEGIRWVVIGLFFKLALADNFAVVHPDEALGNPFLVWIEAVRFGLRIYFDFAGYSLIALGVALCLGIRLTLNFRSPYLATSIQDFWRRWHVTLSTWFRDYVYFPLGGSRTRFWMANILIVFLVSGLWHGAGWNFVIWGGLHGLLLVIQHRLGISLPTFLGWLLTMLFVFLCWICFLETRTDVLLTKLGTICNPGLYTVEMAKSAIVITGGAEGFLLLSMLIIASLVILGEWLSQRWTDKDYNLLMRNPVQIIMVILTILLAPTTNNSFIYFAF